MFYLQFPTSSCRPELSNLLRCQALAQVGTTAGWHDRLQVRQTSAANRRNGLNRRDEANRRNKAIKQIGAIKMPRVPREPLLAPALPPAQVCLWRRFDSGAGLTLTQVCLRPVSPAEGSGPLSPPASSVLQPPQVPGLTGSLALSGLPGLLRGLPGLPGQREPHGEPAAFPLLGLHLDGAAHLGHRLPRHRQPDAGALVLPGHPL